MKITIEGEPEEIAALELALKDGGNETIGQTVLKDSEPVECPRKWD